MMSHALTMTEVLSKVEPFSITRIGILDELCRSQSTVADLKLAIEQDVALSARMLSIANSPSFGHAGHIYDIGKVCIMMGYQAVSNLVLAATVLDHFYERGDETGTHYFWRHSFMVAWASRELSHKVDIDPDIAYYCGLFHDMGSLVLNTFFTTAYRSVMEYRDVHACSLCDAEKEILNVDHTDVGAGVGEYWNFPPEYNYVMKNHHSPAVEDTEQNRLVHLVYSADIVAQSLRDGDLINQNVSQLDAIGLNVGDLRNCVREIELKMTKARAG